MDKKFTVEEIREGCADLWGNVECMTCSRLLGYIKDLLDSRASVAAPPPDTLNEPCGYCNGTRKEVAGYDGRIVPCAYCTGDQAALHWPFTPKHDNCIECAREYEPPPSPVAVTVDAEPPVRCVHCGATEHSYQQDWDHPFESLAVAAPSLGSSIQAAAAEICDYFGDTELAMGGHVNANGVATILSKWLGAAPRDRAGWTPEEFAKLYPELSDAERQGILDDTTAATSTEDKQT